MEKNTVVLDLVYYNELRDFRDNMVKNGMVHIYDNNNYYSLTYITTDSVIKQIGNINKELIEKIGKLENQIKNEKSISEIKTMNIIEFLLWKFKK